MTLHAKVLVKGVIYGVWLTTVDAVTVCTYPIPAKSFLCSNNPMDKFELKFFQLIFFAFFEAILKASVQISVSIEISLSHLSAPVWGDWCFLTRSR